MTTQNVQNINKQLFDIASLIAAYKNAFMFVDLRNLPEETILQDLYGLEEMFDKLMAEKTALQN